MFEPEISLDEQYKEDSHNSVNKKRADKGTIQQSNNRCGEKIMYLKKSEIKHPTEIWHHSFGPKIQKYEATSEKFVYQSNNKILKVKLFTYLYYFQKINLTIILVRCLE